MPEVSLFNAVVFGLIWALARLLHGGLVRKWQSHVMKALACAPLFLMLPLVHAIPLAVALSFQWFSPGRDFSDSKSLIEAHFPWALVACMALMSPFPLIGAIMVPVGYWGFQKFWHSSGFWKPTICAEAWAGFWVGATVHLTTPSLLEIL